MELETFATLAALLVLLAGQIGLVQALVALIKTGFGVTGKALIVCSIVAGIVVGALVFGMAYDALIAPFALYSQIIVGVFFLLISGVAASGFYDLKRE